MSRTWHAGSLRMLTCHSLSVIRYSVVPVHCWPTLRYSALRFGANRDLCSPLFGHCWAMIDHFSWRRKTKKNSWYVMTCLRFKAYMVKPRVLVLSSNVQKRLFIGFGGTFLTFFCVRIWIKENFWCLLVNKNTKCVSFLDFQCLY